jgi:hypothetical protein
MMSVSSAWDLIVSGMLGRNRTARTSGCDSVIGGTVVTVASMVTVVAGMVVTLPGRVRVTAGRVVVIAGRVIVDGGIIRSTVTVVTVAQPGTNDNNRVPTADTKAIPVFILALL